MTPTPEARKCRCGGKPKATPAMLARRDFRCSDCVREGYMKWKRANRDKIAAHTVRYAARQRARQRTPEYRAYRRRKNNAPENRARRQARQKVRDAIERGALVRPTFCHSCGAVRPVHAHHHRGYAHPLAVRWLCASCHREAHQEAA